MKSIFTTCIWFHNEYFLLSCLELLIFNPSFVVFYLQEEEERLQKIQEARRERDKEKEKEKERDRDRDKERDKDRKERSATF